MRGPCGWKRPGYRLAHPGYICSEANPVMSAMERPALIGKPIPRAGVRRFLRGRGRYVGDINLPRMLHLVFVRSPLAHARIVFIHSEAAKRAPRVALNATVAQLAAHCSTFITVVL